MTSILNEPGTRLYMHFRLKIFACKAIINCLISFFVLQLHVPIFNWLSPLKLNLYKPLNNVACHRIYIEEFSLSSDICNFIVVSSLNFKSA